MRPNAADIPKDGPRCCCSDFAIVTDDVDGEQCWKCPVCDRTWTVITREAR